MKASLHRPEPGPERWLISYSDFITLLFALFVVMYAVGQTNHGDGKAVAASVQRLLGQAPATASQTAVISALPPPAGARELEEAHSVLARLLHQEIAEGQMALALESRGIVITLREKGFFSSGSDRLDAAECASLGKVAGVIRGLPNPVRLEGHTDSLRIHNARFRSNWDLSAARAIAVLTFMEEAGVDPQRIAIAGYADNRPVADNASSGGRALNRRVDLVIGAVVADEISTAAILRP